ncbi:MAG: DUF6489 family protein [Janthinobacterium lividum]|nr:MAG: hypothetical protein EON55_00370 [Alphaproteobacteria bacterium]
MKVKFEVECTPDEARQFFGLPDVKPMQDAMMSKLESQMTEAVDRFSPDSLLRSWFAFAPAGADVMRDMFDRLTKPGRPS